MRSVPIARPQVIGGSSPSSVLRGAEGLTPVCRRRQAQWMTYLAAQAAGRPKLIVVTAGTYGSPAMVLRSGPGFPKARRDANFALTVPLLGVGANLHDDPLLYLEYEKLWIELGLLDDQWDLDALAYGLRLGRKLAGTEPLRRWLGLERWPGAGINTGTGLAEASILLRHPGGFTNEDYLLGRIPIEADLAALSARTDLDLTQLTALLTGDHPKRRAYRAGPYG